MRELSLFIYPLVYPFRWKIRSYLYGRHKEFFEDRVWSMDGFTVDKPQLSILDRIIMIPWFFLDDSPAKDNISKVNPSGYDESSTWDSSDGISGYPYQFIFNNRVLRDFWWSVMRNNRVNIFSYFREMGGFSQDSDAIEVLTGNVEGTKMFNLWNVKHVDGKRYLYLIMNFGSKRCTIGQTEGSGRMAFC